MEIKCVKADDGWGDKQNEYYWTMNVANENPPVSKLEDGDGNTWKAEAGDERDINASASQSCSDSSAADRPIPVYIDLYEDDGGSGGIVGSGDDYMGTTMALLTYNYDKDQWKWEYEGSNWNKHGNLLKNPDITINNGYEETFTEKYKVSSGDTNVTITISWRDE